MLDLVWPDPVLAPYLCCGLIMIIWIFVRSLGTVDRCAKKGSPFEKAQRRAKGIR